MEGCDPPADGWPPGPGLPCPAPPAVRRRRQGTRGPPLPPPPPSHSGPRADGGGPKKRRPHTPPEEAAAPGVRGHHGRGPVGRRRVSAAGGGGEGGGDPPPWFAPLSSPGRPLIRPLRLRRPRRRRSAVGRQQAGRVGACLPRRPRPPGNPHGTSIPRGGTPGATAGRPTPDGAGGRRGGPPTTPPPAPPPARERPSAPPESRRRPLPPRRDRNAGGGGATGPAPAGVAAAGRAHTSVPEQRAQPNSMGAAPHMTLP